MPDGPTNAWKFLHGKVSVPSEMRTAEWNLVAQDLRERAFWMAGVKEAEILQEFRDRAEDVAAGRLSEAAAFKELRMALTRLDYQPAPGEEGTIHDLRTLRRMQVTLRTNVAIARGYMQQQQGRLDMTATPGWELVRFLPADFPRDWPARWAQAGGPPPRGGRLIALKDDPVWAKLGSREEFEDALGLDYPPFAWGSGMAWAGVGFREMEALGLIPEGWRPPPPAPPESPNRTLEATPRVTDPELRTQLAGRLQGLAQFDGERLIFTDPNGTRPATPVALAELWARPLPPHFAGLPGGGQLQREQFLAWLREPAGFDHGAGDPGWWHLLRLAARLVTPPPESPLARVWMLGAEAAAELLGRWRAGHDYITAAWQPLETWAAAAAVAAPGPAADGRWSVRLVLAAGARVAKEIGALARALGAAAGDLWVVAAGTRLKVNSVAVDTAARSATVHLSDPQAPTPTPKTP